MLYTASSLLPTLPDTAKSHRREKPSRTSGTHGIRGKVTSNPTLSTRHASLRALSRLGIAERFPRFEDGNPSSGCRFDQLLEVLRVGLDEREGVVVHWDGDPGPQ